MSNFAKRTKRASKEIAYDAIHAKAKEQHYYPGISYQRLFDAINEAGPTPTISQMTDIIHVVKTDFIDDKKETGKMYSGKEVADMMKASYKAGCRIDLKKLQSVLHNVQNVMAGYSQDDTWSDYDRQSHAELIEMQYIVEDEIYNVQPPNDMQCGVGENNI